MPHIRGRQLLVMDQLVIAVSAATALVLSANANSGAQPVAYLVAVAVPVLVRPLINLRFGLYQRIWRHASIPEVLQILMAVGAGSIAAFGLVTLFSLATHLTDSLMTRSFWVIEGLLSLALVGGVRFAIRVAAEGMPPAGGGNGVPTIIYGADARAVMAIRAARDQRAGIRAIAVLDDDSRLWGSTVAGLMVRGDLSRLEELAAETGARRLLIATALDSGPAVRRAMHEATRVGLEVRTIPRMHELFDGTLDAYKFRHVRVDDLLQRPPVADHVSGVADLITGKVVMITGAGGSIGSELARQAFAMRPERLILIDRAGGPLYGIQRELELATWRGTGSGELSVHIANVATRSTMRRLVRTGQPDIIFHAAAYKHVPMMEEHPSDAVQVNIGGTLSVLEAAEACGVPQFVFISTDKAVRPSSVMGATKRVAEALVNDAAQRTGRRYVSVRFGNVLGSSGSVVPIFQQQLENGEPLTITHPDMTRYFMTIFEAVWLILDAAAIAPPGSLCVLDMGEPVKIIDLAHDLIRLSGRDPDSVPISFIGLRPGEKLHEQLFYAGERVSPTASEKMMLAVSQQPPPSLRDIVDRLISMADGEQDGELKKALFGVTDLLERMGAREERGPRSSRRSYPATAAVPQP